MPDTTIPDPILETIRRSGKPSIGFGGAAWLVWPSEPRSGVSAAMSSAQFVHFDAPVLAVQTGGRMEYFDEDGQRRWTSNLPWPRANLEMARLLGPPDILEENGSNEKSSEETTSGEDSAAG